MKWWEIAGHGKNIQHPGSNLETVVTVVGLMKVVSRQGIVGYLQVLLRSSYRIWWKDCENAERRFCCSYDRTCRLAWITRRFSLAHQEEVVIKWMKTTASIWEISWMLSALRLWAEGKGPHMFDISAVWVKKKLSRRMRRSRGTQIRTGMIYNFIYSFI